MNYKEFYRVVVLDTGYNEVPGSNVHLCLNGHKDFTGRGLNDVTGHGTHIANVIADRLKDPKGVCFIIVKWFHTANDNDDINFIDAMKYIATLKDVHFMNYSASGVTPYEEEKNALMQMLKNGVSIFTAAGNKNIDLDSNCSVFIACYKIPGINVVGNVSKVPTDSNYGKIVNMSEDGQDVFAETGIHGKIQKSGTSQATAIATSKAINRRMK